MAQTTERIDFGEVTNETVWTATRTLFLAALGFFLINIALGFLNALTTGPIEHWQIVTHLHSAALGWFSLSVLAIAFWVFTGDRTVSSGYTTQVRALTYLAILAVLGYVASFALAFSQGGELMNLLPIFGGAVLIVVWAATIFVFLQFRNQPVVTTIHIFVAGALLVLSVGGTMGVLIGLNRATGGGIADVGAHAPVMLFYLLLVASAIVEWFVVEDGHGRWSRSGLAQALVVLIAALVPPIAISFDLMMLMPLMLLGLILFLLLFLVRVGWKALYTNPLESGPRAWTFFGTAWLIPVILLFPAEVAIEPPSWFFPVLAHAAFVGMMSNLLFGVLSDRTAGSPRLHAWAEPGAMWLMNLGVLVFLAGKITMDLRHGAFIMGLGALLGVAAMGYRLLR